MLKSVITEVIITSFVENYNTFNSERNDLLHSALQ